MIFKETNEKGLKAFFQSWAQVMKGRLTKFLVIVLMLAIPIAMVTAYASNKQFSEAVQIYKSMDFETFSSMTDEAQNEFLTSVVRVLNGGLGDSWSAVVLNLVINLLECAVLIIAAVYFFDASKNLGFFDKNISKATMWTARKTIWVYIIQLIASVFFTGALNLIVLIFMFPILLALGLNSALVIPLLIIFGIVFAVVLWLVNAFIMMYSQNITIAVALSRVRFMFSWLYARVLLHKKKKFSYFLVAFGLLGEVLIPLLVAFPAFYLNYTGSDSAIYFWGCASLITVFIKAINMTFFTANFLQLEKEKAADLRNIYPPGLAPTEEDQNSDMGSDNQD